MPCGGTSEGGRNWISLHRQCISGMDAEGTGGWQEEQGHLFAALWIQTLSIPVAMLLIVILILDGT